MFSKTQPRKDRFTDMASYNPYTIRLVVVIFNLGVLHHILNGYVSCTVHNNWTAVGLVVQLLSTYLNENIYISLAHILFGAFFLMSVKPHDWLFSYKWDCGTQYENNNTVSRAAMLGYALIVYGTESMMRLLRRIVDGDKLLCCQRSSTDTWGFCGCIFSNSAMYFIILTEIACILFGCCALFVFVAGGFS